MKIEINEKKIQEEIEKKIPQIVGRYIEDHFNIVEYAIRKEIYDQIDRKYFDLVKGRLDLVADEAIIETAASIFASDLKKAYADAYYD